jgi:gamma-glutamylcyclotransferase (GGCT)/AIG2-like uncharacterized protein YtfP
MEITSGQLFVYGSLRSGFHHPAYAYISRYFTLIGNAQIKGLLFDMGEYPAAVPAADNNFILGELYQINHMNEFSWAMAQLDDYEGLNTEADETPLYRREIADVYRDNQVVKAWVYWFNGSVAGKPKIASGDVLEFKKHKS